MNKFFENTNKDGSTPDQSKEFYKGLGQCWEWIPKTDRGGYGVMRFNNTKQKAHRVSWQIHFGKIPQGLCVCHKCDNRRCVNPDHLFLGDVAANLLDRANKGLGISRYGYVKRPAYVIKGRPKGGRNGRAKLSVENVISIREMRDSGKTLHAVADTFGITHSTVSKIVNRSIWGHI